MLSSDRVAWRCNHWIHRSLFFYQDKVWENKQRCKALGLFMTSESARSPTWNNLSAFLSVAYIVPILKTCYWLFAVKSFLFQKNKDEKFKKFNYMCNLYIRVIVYMQRSGGNLQYLVLPFYHCGTWELKSGTWDLVARTFIHRAILLAEVF